MKRGKRPFALLLSLLLLLGTALPIQAADKAGDALQVTPESTSVESGGTAEFTVTGDGLEQDVIVRLADLLGEQTVSYNVEKISNREQKIQVTFPENPSDWDKMYTLNFYRNGSDQAACTVSVTVLKAGGQMADPMIYSIRPDRSIIGEDGNREVAFTVYGEALSEQVDVQVSQAGQVQAMQPEFEEITATKHVFVLKFPENTGKKDLVYEVNVSPAGSDQWNYSVDITVKPEEQQEEKEPIIGEIHSAPLGSDGLTYEVSFEGESLTDSNVFISVYPEDNVSITGKSIHTDGGNFIITFPKNTTGKDKEYYLYIGTINGSQKEQKFIIKSSSGEEEREEVDVKPESVFIDDSYKEIIMIFPQPVQSAADNIADLKDKIKLMYGNNWNPLDEAAEVSVEGKKIVIRLAVPYQPLFGSMMISFGEGTLETMDQKLIKPFEWLVDDMARVTGIEITPEILQSEGGEVTALLKGYHLQKAVISGSLFDPETGLENEDVKVAVKEDEAGRLSLTYSVPANHGDTTQCWLLKVAVNGVTVTEGLDYTDVAGRPLVSVLPAGASEQDITLGSMTISSYGTNPDPGNLQYTETSLNQESKKTQIHLYGTNLDPGKTKVKIIDEDGVEWPVYNEPRFDSVTYFIMVANDGTGITGNGNHQILEVICPRNIGYNRLYHIYVSVDGENFIEDQHVSVRVLNEDQKGVLDPVKRTVTVQHVDRDGREIAPSTSFTGYSWFFMADLGIEAQQIEGYKAVRVPEFGEMKETIGDQDRTLQIVYEQENGQTTDPGTGPVTPPDKDPGSTPEGGQGSGAQGGGQPAGQPGAAGAGGNAQQMTAGGAVRTGDESRAGAAAAGMILSFAAAAVIVVKRRHF